MLASLLQWFDHLAPLVFWTCASVLIAIDAAAVAAVASTKSRALVNRWTGTVLALNAFLIGAGAGIPLALYAVNWTVRTFAPSAVTTFSSEADAATQPK